MIFEAPWDACPVGCGNGMLFLKRADTGAIFLYCTACGAACDRAQLEAVTFDSTPDAFAPRGIALPTREEIEGAGWRDLIAGTRSLAEGEAGLWELRAITFIADGRYERAIEVVSDVICTWHGPPEEAYALRARAYRMLGGRDDAALADEERAATMRRERERERERERRGR